MQSRLPSQNLVARTRPLGLHRPTKRAHRHQMVLPRLRVRQTTQGGPQPDVWHLQRNLQHGRKPVWAKRERVLAGST